MQPNFSIIIPHKDIPNLLQRCLDSIPVRDDVQVIVVDDNSDPRKVDFRHFPRWQGRQYEYYLTKAGKGPGHARNVGLGHAKGRWIIFADADDFFTDGFNTLLDEMADTEEDLVFFDYINVSSDDITRRLEERTWFRTYIEAYFDGNKSEDRLRFYFAVPWCKMHKREMIERHQVRFNEVMWGEDVFFAALVGYHAKAIKVSGVVGYAVTSRKDSVTDRFCATPEEFRVRVGETLKCDDLLETEYGPHYRSSGLLGHIYRKKGKWMFVWFCVANVFHPQVFWRSLAFLRETRRRNRM